MSTFHERQKCLFNQLKQAEEQYSFAKLSNIPPEVDYGVIDKYTYRKLKHEMKQFKRKESIFKRPEANLYECLRAKTIPDYIKNPKKWVYYSLSDVTPDQMSDSTNTATALALIHKLEEQEALKKCEEESTKPDIFKKPIFQVSKTIKKQPVPDQEKSVFKCNKVIMPEYVVGLSQKKEKRNRNIDKMVTTENTEKVKVELKLNHLYEDDEGDE